jgi:hypothetical protein
MAPRGRLFRGAGVVCLDAHTLSLEGTHTSSCGMVARLIGPRNAITAISEMEINTRAIARCADTQPHLCHHQLRWIPPKFSIGNRLRVIVNAATLVCDECHGPKRQMSRRKKAN